MVTINETGKEPIAGTSKKRKRFKKSEEDELVEDVKELTECIVRNSLNRIQEPPVVIQIPDVVEVHEEVDGQVVANGDLANNNRDVEGNNCVAVNENNENVG